MKLAIGTANFGNSYGLKKIKLEEKEIDKIFKFLDLKGINLIDTASVYGRSEKIIGNHKLKKKKVVTKIFVKNQKFPEKYAFSLLKKNLQKLKVKKIYACLIHNIYDVEKKNKILFFKSLKYLKKSNIVKKIGFSIYSPEDIKNFKIFFKPDILQIPINIFDRRFENRSFKKYIYENKIEIHSRSCFLQGLIINYQKKNIKFKKFQKWNFLFKRLDKFCEKFSINRIEACILYLRKNKMINYAIFGFDNIKQLEMIYSSFNLNLRKLKFPKGLSSKDEKLIDPRKW
tara:strand:- start:1364 stop:2221 length:858 start_codon:yes stop_codon:yes gene_type:complete